MYKKSLIKPIKQKIAKKNAKKYTHTQKHGTTSCLLINFQLSSKKKIIINKIKLKNTIASQKNTCKKHNNKALFIASLNDYEVGKHQYQKRQ